MHNGEKEITADLDNLKLFVKVHVFMLLFHFFTEGLSKYDIDDVDLPNQCKQIFFHKFSIDDSDVENAPRLNFKMYLNNSIL